MAYAFISYSTKDKDKAEEMQKLLNDEGISTWMAPYSIPVGKKYHEVMSKAIKDCSCVVLMLSNAAQNSIWVSKEIERAINYLKPLFPVQLEDVVLNDEFEFYISNTPIIAIQTIDKANPEIGRLLECVAACTGVRLKSATSLDTTSLVNNTKYERVSNEINAYVGSEPYAFISYSHKDQDEVYNIIRGLQNKNARIWFDKGLEIGKEWPEEIAKHLINSSLVLVMLSANALQSANVKREINLAFSEEKNVIGIKLDDVDLSPGMKLQFGLYQMITKKQYDSEKFIDLLSKAVLNRLES